MGIMGCTGKKGGTGCLGKKGFVACPHICCSTHDFGGRICRFSFGSDLSRRPTLRITGTITITDITGGTIPDAIGTVFNIDRKLTHYPEGFAFPECGMFTNYPRPTVGSADVVWFSNSGGFQGWGLRYFQWGSLWPTKYYGPGVDTIPCDGDCTGLSLAVSGVNTFYYDPDARPNITGYCTIDIALTGVIARNSRCPETPPSSGSIASASCSGCGGGRVEDVTKARTPEDMERAIMES